MSIMPCAWNGVISIDMRTVHWIESAETLMKRLDGSPTVAGIVPPGFERYLRIFSTVGVRSSSGPDALELHVPWSLICEQLEIEFKPNILWQRDIVSAEPRVTDFQEPGWGAHDIEALERVGTILQQYETEDRSWYFASWIGYGVAESDQTVWFPSHHHEALEMSVFERWNEADSPFIFPLVPSNQGSGTLLSIFGDAASAEFTPPSQQPMYWWPEGHDWVLGQPLYGRSAYLACSNAIADDVLATSGIEAIQVELSDEADHEE